MHTNTQASKKLSEAHLRIEEIIWLAGAVEGFSDPDFFEDTILDASNGAGFMHESMAVFRDLPDWVQDQESFCEWAEENEILGFVVQVCTPKPVAFHANGHTSHGFGYTSGTFIYVEAIADVVPLAVEWRDRMMAKWKTENDAA